jgi:uncharacterized membrane protein (UPF0182 family)
MQMLKAVRYGIVIAVLVVAVALGFFSHFFTDIWWFESLGYLSTYLAQFGWLWGVRIGVTLLTTLFLFANLWITRSQVAAAITRWPQIGQANFTWRRIRNGYLLACVALGILYGMAAGSSWQKIAFFLNRQPFGIVDPIYHHDVGFYVFTLPFYDYLNNLAFGLFLVALLATGSIYLLSGAFNIQGFRIQLQGPARWHLGTLLIGIVSLRGWRYALDLYDLLYSTRGAVYGAGYTDLHANALAIKILIVVTVLVALSIIVALIGKKTRLIVSGVVTLLLASFLVGGVYPSLVQRFLVDPNELERERPYLNNHIQMTRAAFGLDEISEFDFDSSDALTRDMVEANRLTFDNIRLWDWRPTLSAYRQLQEFRLYYDFMDVDVDRYVIDGDYRQVMVAARELSADSLQNPTWINQHMQYTHGYGMVISPVNEITQEGLPEFFASDIPPRGVVELQVDRPEIYYGERTNQYVLVNTRTPEFDFPQGDSNATTFYQGTGGVQLTNYFKRIAFAVRFGTTKLLLATDISSQSRIMFYRNIQERVQKIAPFLKYDADPYLVVADKRLYWIQDAYTSTNRFPYVQPVRGWGNYVRNSVKVVIDAYNGDVTFYAVDMNEPILAALQGIYGGLFKPLTQLPEQLRSHLRYPEDLFNLQASLFTTYHMTNTQVFYNQEDAWSLPRPTESQTFEPYYMIMRLPGSNQEEMVLMLPFTPKGKDNMVAWLAARNDQGNYGEMVLYKFPKQTLTFGPAQVEGRINQDSEISQMLTLWNQQGSNVIRGNLLVIPVENTLIYAEPLYLQAEQSQMPELKMVILVHEGRVATGNDLNSALDALLGVQTNRARTGSVGSVAATQQSTVVISANEFQQLMQIYEKAKQRLQAGDLVGYGQAMADFDKKFTALGQ